MSTQTTPPRHRGHRGHRVSVATARMRELADSVAEASVWSMDDAETGTTLVELTRLAAQVSELQARVAAHADDLHVGREVGASSAANWLAHTTKTTRATTHRTVRLGHDLAAHPMTRDALAAGRVDAEQARVFVRWVDRLPADLGAETHAKAEAHLVAQAGEYDAKALGRLGRRLFEVAAPAEADAHEARILEQQETAAIRACSLTMTDDGDGKTHGRFTLPTFHAAALRKMLTALAAPKHVAATQGAATQGAATLTPGVERRPGPETLGRALCELIERYPADRLPATGGINATMVVLIDEDSLRGRLDKAGILDTGEPISPGTARRLACEAGLLPAVLGGDSVPLDLGRTRRHFTTHQRIAILLRERHRHQGCAAEGCDRTTGLHAHHRTRWTDAGPTNLANAVSLCHWHHHRAHDTHYQTTYHPNGDVTFHRRT